MNLHGSVYVVDDEEEIRLSLGALLRLWGLSVYAFSSAEEFWVAYRDSWSGILMVDLRLPGQSGIELLEELKRKGSSLPAFLITGHGDEDIFRQAIASGAAGSLSKPFHTSQLKEALTRFLHQ